MRWQHLQQVFQAQAHKVHIILTMVNAKRDSFKAFTMKLVARLQQLLLYAASSNHSAVLDLFIQQEKITLPY